MKRQLRIVVKLLIGALVVMIAAFAAFSAVTRSQLRAELARIKAEGAPLVPADLVPRAIPASQNAAVMYDRVRDRCFGPGRCYCPSILDRYLTPGTRPGERPSEADADAALSRCRVPMKMIEEAAALPKSQYRVDWRAGLGATFEHLSYLRGLNTLLRARALLYARRGNSEEAVRSIRFSFAFGESLKGKPTTIVCQRVRGALVSRCVRSLLDVLRVAKVSQTQLRSLYETVSRIDLVPETTDSIRGEMVLTSLVFDHLRKGGRQAFVEMFGPDADHGLTWEQPSWRSVSLSRLAGTWLCSPVLDADELCFMRHTRRQIRLADKPYRILKATGECQSDPGFPGYACATRTVAIVPGEVQQNRDVAIAHLALAQAALALEAYHVRYHAYPASLRQLHMAIGWRLREDPFSGRDLRYARRENGFILYSIGPDLRDDRGAELHYDDARPGRGDIVWARS